MSAHNVEFGNATELRSRGKESHSFNSPAVSKDEMVLARFGKRQQLRRGFRTLSAVGLVCGVMLSWEVLAMSLLYGLQNGGPAGLVYGFMFAWVGQSLQALVMAEMSSMIPLAGGPFNWVAILAPPWCRKFLSYLAGWLTVIAWQCFVANTGYVSGTLVQGLLVLNHPSYVYERWHGTLLFYAVVAFSLFINTYLARFLPRIEALMLVIHIVGFFGVLIPLVYLAPHNSASEVFANFQNFGGWSSTGLSFFVGFSTAMNCFLGVDGADHIAEEIQDAQRVIPLSIISSMILNGLTGFAMLMALMFCLTSVENAVNSDTGYPIIEILASGVGSNAGGTVLTSIILFAQMFSCIGILATSSRMLWAFARENGLPGSSYIAKIDPRTRLPLWAIGVTTAVNMLLALVNIGSSEAYQAFISLLIAAYFSSFLLAAGVMLHKRLTTPKSKITWGPFRLGRAGVPITIVAMLYTVLGLFFSFWPAYVHVNAQTMNYSPLIFGGTLIFSLGFWIVYGRKVYTGPIIEAEIVSREEIAIY